MSELLSKRLDLSSTEWKNVSVSDADGNVMFSIKTETSVENQQPIITRVYRGHGEELAAEIDYDTSTADMTFISLRGRTQSVDDFMPQSEHFASLRSRTMIMPSGSEYRWNRADQLPILYDSLRRRAAQYVVHKSLLKRSSSAELQYAPYLLAEGRESESLELLIVGWLVMMHEIPRHPLTHEAGKGTRAELPGGWAAAGEVGMAIGGAFSGGV